MKKKTILLGLLVAGMAVTSVSGCSSKKTDSNNSSEQQNQTKPAGVHTVYYVVDGKVVSSIDYKDGDTSIIEIGVPKKEGYEGVWSSYSLNGEDVYVVAVYYKKNVDYSIEYYLQNLDNDGYTKDDDSTSHFSTTEYSTVTPTIKSFTGFSCINSTIEQSIDETNNVIKVYYDRNTYTIDYTTNNGLPIDSQTVKYGTVVSQPNIVKNGYTLINWTNNNQVYDFTQPVNKNLDLVANWEANEGIQYKINYYLENVDNDEYTLSSEYSKTLTGNTDEAISASDVKPEGFELDTTKSIMEGTISYDSKTELNVYYKRKRFNITYNGADGQVYKNETAKYGQKLVSYEVSKEGYTHQGWTVDGASYDFNNIVTSDLVLDPFFVPKNNVTVTVNYYFENTYDDEYTLYTSIPTYGTAGSEFSYSASTGYYGMELTNPNETVIINGDGTSELNFYYKRTLITIDYSSSGYYTADIESKQFKYGIEAKYTIPEVDAPGYEISSYYLSGIGYIDSNTITGVTSSRTLTVEFYPRTLKYRTEYYFENLDDDEYTLSDEYSYEETAQMGSEVGSADTFTGYTLYEEMSNPTGYVKPDNSLVLKLYYKRNRYNVTFNTNVEGVTIDSKVVKYGTIIEEPEVTKVGYSLDHWHYESWAWDFEAGVDRDLNLRAIWNKNQVKVRVEVYKENLLDDEYTLDEDNSFNDTAYTDDTYNCYVSVYDGFDYYEEASNSSALVAGDGSTVLKLYYKRKRYNITYTTNVEGVTIDSKIVKYGTVLEKPEITKVGYSLDHWHYQSWSWNFDDFVDQDLDLEAIWTKNIINSTVYIYYENINDDEYTLFNTTSFETYVDKEYTYNYSTPTGFELDNNSIVTAYVNPDNSTVFKIYFKRLRKTINYYNYDDNGRSDIVDTKIVKYGTTLEAPYMTRTGYTLTGYNYDFSNPITESLNIYPQYEANTNTKYTINIYYNNINDDEYTLEETIIEYGTTDTNFSYNSFYKNYKERTGFELFSYYDLIIKGDGSTVIELYYNRIYYDVHIDCDDHVSINLGGNYKYGTELEVIPEFDNNLAYTFDGIYNADDNYIGATYSFTVTEDIYFYIKTIENEELKPFIYSSSDEYLSIEGFKDGEETEDLVIPNIVTDIAGYAFSEANIKTIRLGDNVKSIGSRAFYNLPNEISIYFNSKLETINSEAFAFTKFENNSLLLPDSVTDIGGSAFTNSGLEIIHLSDNLETIGSNAFSNDILINATINAIPNTVITISSNAFYNIVFDEIAFEDDSVLETIGSDAFSYNNDYENDVVYDVISIPSSVKEIGNCAFKYVHFNTLYFEEGSKIETIGESAFALNEEDDIVITPILFPVSLTYIGQYAFQFRQIESVAFEEGIDVEFGYYPFQNAKIATLYYVDGVNSRREKGFYNSNIDEIIICNNVSEIKDETFYNAYATKVTFEEDSILETIGEYAFYYCHISIMELPDSLIEIKNNAFAYNKLNFINLGNNVEKVGSEAFYGNDNLTTIVIGESVYQIDEYAFSTTLSYVFNKSILRLAEGEVDYGLVPINSSTYLFQGEEAYKTEIKDGFVLYHESSSVTKLLKYIGDEKEVTIPNYVTSIEENAFSYNDKVEEIIISDHVLSIGSYAFYYCTNLRNVIIGDSVTEIGSYAFQSCYNLRTVVIGDSVETIGTQAFYSCKLLTTLTIGSSVTTIKGGSVFDDCYSLVEIYNKSSLVLTPGDATYGQVALNAKRIVTEGEFESYISEEDDFIRFDYEDEVYLIKYLGSEKEHLIIPDYFTIVCKYAFAYTDIKKITLGENIRVLDNSSFYYSYYYLEEVVFNEKLEIIGNDAFSQCYKLTNVVLPDSVVSIGAGAFFNIHDLCITVGSGLQTIGASAFESSLKEFNFSGENNIETIDTYAFKKCGLLSFELGANLRTIEDGAFSDAHIYEIKNDSSLVLTIGSDTYGEIAKYAVNIYSSNSGESVFITDDNGFTYIDTGSEIILVKYSGESGEDVDIVIPSNVTEIGGYAFEGLTLGNIIISKNVKHIYGYAFYSICCKTLTFEEGSLLEYIDESAFSISLMTDQYYNYYQKELIFPDNLIEIGSYNFRGICVEKIYIPASVTNIKPYSFWNPTTLQCVIIDKDSTMTIINYEVFGASGYNHASDTFYITIPVSVTEIATNAAYDNDGTTYYLYYGNETQWSNVTVSISNYEVYYYSETAPASEGNYWHFDVDGNPVIWTLMTEPITE